MYFRLKGTNMNFDPIYYHKNFNMGNEIDVAGTFIYEGIKQLGKIEVFSVESEVFFFLYTISVGIERLQKILLVLLEDMNYNNFKAFEKSLNTHYHHSLNDRIINKCNVNFSERENGFFEVLDKFYYKCRYGRFELTYEEYSEIELISDYITEYFGRNVEIQYSLWNDRIVNNDKIKDYFGRVIGSISKKYYSEIKETSYKQNIYTYELRTNSPAQKLFLSKFSNNSFHMQNIDESITLKEFFIFLMNNKEDNSFTRFIKTIEPLDIDLGLINEYMEEICKGEVPTALIDEIEELYNELKDKKERFDYLSLVGNSNVLFGYEEITKCYELMKDFVNNKGDCKNFAEQFIEKYELIDDWDITEILEYSKNICVAYLKGNEFFDEIFIEKYQLSSESLNSICVVMKQMTKTIRYWRVL